MPVASVHPMVVRSSDALASVQVGAPKRDQANTKSRLPGHRLNRRRKARHRCIGCTMFQRRCQAHRSQAFSTGSTDGASEHGVGAMTSAKVGGPTASPGAVCDRFNRRPMHRFIRWSMEALQLCQQANDYFSCCSDRKF